MVELSRQKTEPQRQLDPVSGGRVPRSRQKLHTPRGEIQSAIRVFQSERQPALRSSTGFPDVVRPDHAPGLGSLVTLIGVGQIDPEGDRPKTG
jgi:hypothetical protein